MSDTKGTMPTDVNDDCLEEHVFFPRCEYDFQQKKNTGNRSRILLLAFRNEDGFLSKSEIVMDNLVEVSVLEKIGIKYKFLGHMQLEGYPTEPYRTRDRPVASAIERARQFALGAIQTEFLISAETILAGIPEIARAAAVKALAQLSKEGKLARVGHGVYGHPDRSTPTEEEIERQRGRKGRPVNRSRIAHRP